MADAKQVGFLFAGIRHPETDEPLANGAVWTYEEGSTTLSNLYTARDTTEGQHENPLTLDSFGRAEAFGNGVYRFVIRDSDDGSSDILYEMDGVELEPLTSEDSIGTLTSNLDFGGYKGINVGPGVDPADAINKNQLDTEVSTLEDAIDGVQTNLNEHSFLDLDDTDPTSYSGEAGNIVAVNSGEDALEFIPKDSINQDGTFLDNSDTPANYTDSDGKAAIVDEGNEEIIFGYPDSKTIQGVDVDDTTPTDGQVLEYDSTEEAYIPSTPVSAASLTRTVIYSGGGTSSVTFEDGVDYSGNAIFVALDYKFSGNASVGGYRVPNFFADIQMLADVGTFTASRDVYEGGVIAQSLTVAKSGNSYTISGSTLYAVVVYSM